MKVCIAHPELAPGDGSSRYVAEVARLLADEENDVTVACEIVATPLDDRVRVIAPDTNERFDVLLGSDLVLLRRLHSLSEHFVYAPLGMLAWLEQPEEYKCLRALEAWALARCDRLLRFTDAGVRVLEREYGMTLRQKACVGVFLGERSIAGEAPDFERPAPATLLWVGRLTRTKNVEFLLRAVRALRTQDWHLVLCGDGPCRDELAVSAEQLGVEDRVHLRGYVSAEDLREAYRCASVFLTASRVEQYSLTLMEAYAHGTPCIGLRPDMGETFNACPDQIDDGRTGFLVGTPHEMARRIDRLLLGEAERRALGLAGWTKRRKLVQERPFEAALRGAISLQARHGDAHPAGSRASDSHRSRSGALRRRSHTQA